MARRRIESNELDGDSLIHSEIFFTTAVQNREVLKLVIQSKNNGNRALPKMIKKLDICLTQIKAGHGR